MEASVTLYKKTIRGKREKKLYWEISVCEDEIYTRSYYDPEKKHLVEGSKTKIKGKNIGKSNETTPHQQALKTMQSKIDYKIKNCEYSYISDEPRVVKFDIMSLKTSTRDEKWITKGCFQQPKLDGLRCVAVYNETKIKWDLWSKNRKEFLFLYHIKNALEDEVFDKSKIYDGELIHSQGFQKLCNVANVNRKESSEEEEPITYYIFDIIDRETDQANRLAFIYNFIDVNNKRVPIKIVESIEVSTWEEINNIHDYYKEKGYEGSVIRSRDNMYVFRRSSRCMKIKDFDSLEAIVVGYDQGVGKYKGRVIWICSYKGKKFYCIPKATDAEKEMLFSTAQDYIGRELTVQHQGFTKDGVPRFPVGICFRELIE